ncbi:MAG TPA: hypothetical protein VMO26_05675 [Vicinamibacterales bacterium]|nr:hypothetical protein [Vicinamibacterales bacterium]
MRKRVLSLRRIAAAMVLGLLGTSSAGAQPPGAAPARIYIEESIATPQVPTLLEALGPRPFPLGVHVALRLPDEATPDLHRRLDRLAEQGLSLWVAVSAPAAPDDMPAWQAALQEFLVRQPGRIAILEVRFASEPAALQRFALQVAATEARARGSSTLVAAGAQNAPAVAQLVAALTSGDAPYVDLLAALGGGSHDAAFGAFKRAVPDGRLVVRRAQPVDDGPAHLVREVLTTVATETIASAWRSGPALAAGLRAVIPIAGLLSHAIEPLDPEGVGLTLEPLDGAARPAWHRLLFDAETFTTYLAYEGPLSNQSFTAGLRLAVRGTAMVIDAAAGAQHAASDVRWDDTTSRVEVTLPITGRPMLVNFSDDAEQIFVDRTTASAERQLSVEEIVARHRRYAARLDSLVTNYRARALMEQHFRPSLTDPGYDVVTENNFFVDRQSTEWEELSFSVNGSRWGADRPAFPLLQAEKVLSLPLELRLNQDYRYRLAGTEQVDGVDCYRVRFDPVTDAEALYRGTVWIDRRTFARIKVQAVQSRTSPPVVSNEEIHQYGDVTEIDGVGIRLLTSLTARQIILIAGRNLLLEKATTFSEFHVNGSDFVELRETARRGDRIMYRDTERGVRYLVKDGGTRVVSDRATTRARAMAIGVLVDPSFGFPLPIFGINYLDFEFRGRSDTQLAVLFGGVLVAGNLQRPRLAGTPIDVSVDFFGIAAPASDRVYAEGTERDAERVLTWPLSAGLNLGWQYTPFQKALLQYHLRYDAYVRDRTTSETFVVPDSALTHGVGGQWELRRGGYSLIGSGTWFARSQWKPWGPDDALEQRPSRTYAKYAAHLSKDWFFHPFHKVHLNASYFGGSRLDRFSRYQFGLFDDTRIHGVPASGVRFDELAMLRGSYSLNIFEQYRLDLFVEQARGRDRDADARWRPLTGLGAAVNFRAPWNTILRADVGKSFLPAMYRDVGSTVFQIMVLKPLK